jgi:thiamine kinase-like enzyme
MKQCSFHPNTYKSAISYLRASVCRTEATVKNEEKVISRLKEGRKSRESVEQIKQRGYPKGISWSRYITEFKNGHTL